MTCLQIYVKTSPPNNLDVKKTWICFAKPRLPNSFSPTFLPTPCRYQKLDFWHSNPWLCMSLPKEIITIYKNGFTECSLAPGLGGIYLCSSSGNNFQSPGLCLKNDVCGAPIGSNNIVLDENEKRPGKFVCFLKHSFPNLITSLTT